MVDKEMIRKYENAYSHNIRMFRVAKGISQHELGKISSVHKGFLANIENGAKQASMETLAKLAVALGVTVDDLLGDEETENLKRQKLMNQLHEEIKTLDSQQLEEILSYIEFVRIGE